MKNSAIDSFLLVASDPVIKNWGYIRPISHHVMNKLHQKRKILPVTYLTQFSPKGNLGIFVIFLGLPTFSQKHYPSCKMTEDFKFSFILLLECQDFCNWVACAFVVLTCEGHSLRMHPLLWSMPPKLATHIPCNCAQCSKSPLIIFHTKWTITRHVVKYGEQVQPHINNLNAAHSPVPGSSLSHGIIAVHQQHTVMLLGTNISNSQVLIKTRQRMTEFESMSLWLNRPLWNTMPHRNQQISSPDEKMKAERSCHRASGRL